MTPTTGQALPVRGAPDETQKPGRVQRAETQARKRPDLFVVVFAAWTLSLCWFGPRMWSLLDLAMSPLAWASIAYFVLFAQIAWLYGFYNVAVVLFAWIDRRWAGNVAPAPALETPPVAILYTTCDDFVERSAESCVAVNYPNAHIYILDDSHGDLTRARVDAFAARHRARVTVVRRQGRAGFKAGNLNHAIRHAVSEPLFAIVDADEILPLNFLSDLLPYMSDPHCGFVQANHRSRPDAESALARDLGVGIDIHWKWYQPLRYRYGFVMFLGHGALLRRSCWDEVGGFPEIVSEDLGYAIALRERGYHGRFAADVTCLEEFPETVRAFRVRHVKWTRGTCEFLHHWMLRLLHSKTITTAEKLDILFPTLNLPMTFFFFLFMVNGAVFLPSILGRPQDLTFVLMGREVVMPVFALAPGVERVFGWDFYIITLMTIVAPILCFIIDLAPKPLRLARFLAHSTALYAALSPLSFIAVIGYAITRKAHFLVTGAVATASMPAAPPPQDFWSRTHPDDAAVQGFEVAVGAGFLAAAIATFQVSFAGVALGFMMLPLMHRVGWKRGPTRQLSWAPFSLMLVGVSLGAFSVAGLQTVFFGFGFHF